MADPPVPLEVSLLNAQRWYRASQNPRMTALFKSGQAQEAPPVVGGDL